MHGALPQLHLQFHAVCTKGDMQTSSWYLSLPHAPVSFSGSSFNDCTLHHLHCHTLLYTRSVEHVTVKVGEDQSHLGKQEVLECIASESTIYIYTFFFLLQWQACGSASSPGKLDSLGTSSRPIKHMQHAFVCSIQLLLSKLAY